MSLIDPTGHRVSGANSRSLAHYEKAARELLCMVDDPAASVDRAIEAGPEMTMAHLLKAWLHLLGIEPAGIEVAKACCSAAAALDADERERGHLDAAQALVAGRWQEAALRLEDLSARFPLDTLALQAGHQIDFFPGDSRMLRDRIARALPAWDSSSRAGMRCSACTRSGSRRPATTRRPSAQGRRSDRTRAARQLGLARGSPRPRDAQCAARRHRVARADARDWSKAASSPPQRLAPRAVPARARPARRGPRASTTRRSAAPARRSCSTWSTPARCCGGCICAASRSASAGGDRRTLGRARARRTLRVQRPARDDRLRARRPSRREQQALIEAQHEAMRSDVDNAAFTRDVGHAGDACGAGFRRRRLRAGGGAAETGPQRRAPLRRQPCAARPDRPDPARRRRPGRRPAAGGSARRRARGAAAEQPGCASAGGTLAVPG